MTPAELELMRRRPDICKDLSTLLEQKDADPVAWKNQELREQLAECQKERDNFKEAVSSYMKAYDDCREEHTTTHAKLVALEEETAPKWRRYERVCEQLASVTKERDGAQLLVQLSLETAEHRMALQLQVTELTKERDELQVLNNRMLVEYEQRMEQLNAISKEAIELRKSLIRWRADRWPETDQVAVIDKAFPVVAALVKEKTK